MQVSRVDEVREAIIRGQYRLKKLGVTRLNNILHVAHLCIAELDVNESFFNFFDDLLQFQVRDSLRIIPANIKRMNLEVKFLSYLLMFLSEVSCSRR